MKARYLRELSESSGFKGAARDEMHRRLAREIGSTSNYVARLLAGLSVYEELEDRKFFGIASMQEEEGDRYSVLTTAVTSYTNIATYIGLEGPTDANRDHLKADRLQNLARWVFDREPGKKARVPESRDLASLNRVLACEAARDRFENGSTLEEADLLTEGPVEAFRTAVAEAKSLLQVAKEIVHKASGLTDADVEQVNEVRLLATALYGAAKEIRNPEK
jgi:hypothetical protein